MRKWILFTISFTLFIVISLYVSIGMTNDFDLCVYNFIISFRNDYLTNFLKFITFFGGEYAIVLIAFAFLFVKNKKIFTLVFFDMILIVLLNYYLKIIFMRDRPFSLMIIDETGYSYPSGHSMIAVGFYGFILYLMWHMNISKSIKYMFSILMGLLIVLIGVSRIYLGVHFPSDVLGGYSVSLCFLVLYISLIKERFL